MSSIDIGILVALVGCFVGLAGWLAGRDKRISNDAEWRGSVNTKLDIIAVGIKGEVEGLKCTVTSHGERITATEESVASAHKRIDEIVDKK